MSRRRIARQTYQYYEKDYTEYKNMLCVSCIRTTKQLQTARVTAAVGKGEAGQKKVGDSSNWVFHNIELCQNLIVTLEYYCILYYDY